MRLFTLASFGPSASWEERRERIATATMQGLLAMQASPHLGAAGRDDGAAYTAYWDHGNCEVMAKDAVALADALIAELAK